MTNSVINILLAEDNEDDVVLFRMAMEKANVSAKLQHVADGADALAYLKGEDAFGDREAHPLPDLVLLDLNMPRRNGFEVLEWIRQDATYKIRWCIF